MYFFIKVLLVLGGVVCILCFYFVCQNQYLHLLYTSNNKLFWWLKLQFLIVLVFVVVISGINNPLNSVEGYAGIKMDKTSEIRFQDSLVVVNVSMGGQAARLPFLF